MPEIKYVFTASGHDTVRRAYQTAADAEEKAAASHERASKKSKSAAQTQAEAWKKAQEKGAETAARNQIKAYEAAQKAAERAAEQQVRSAEKTRQQDVKAAERAQQKEAKATEKAKQQETRAAERAAQEKTRAAEKAARDETRAAEKAAREQSKIVAKQEATDQGARIMAQRARERMDARYAKLRGAMFKDPAKAAQGAGRDGGLSTMDIIKGTMVGGFAMRGAMAAVGIVQDAARSVMSLQEAANRTSINARGAGTAFVDPADLIRDAQAAALGAPGQKAAEIMQAMQSFVSMTGELGTARESAGTFATVAAATGSNVGDVSKAAGSIYNQFGLKTKEEMQDVLASLTFQGKQGAFELSDAASQFQRLAAAGASFGLTGSKGVKTIGGLAQIARTGTGSAEQTTTAIENIFTNLIAKSAILKGQGVNVYDKSGKTRDVTEVLIEAIAKSGKGNFEKKGQILQKVFGDQGIRGVRPLMAKYQAAFQGVRDKGGTEAEATAAGVKRLREEIEKSVNAPGAWDEVQKDAAQAAKDSSAQMTQAFELVQASLTRGVGPAIGAFASALEGTVKYLVDKGIIDDPADDKDVKRNRQTLDQMKKTEQEMLAAGPMDEAQFAEFAVLQEAMKAAEVRNMSDKDLQRGKDVLYGKGGVMSADDEAEADRLQAEIARRAAAPGVEQASYGPMSRDQFTTNYGSGGFWDDAKMWSTVNAAEMGVEPILPDWAMSVGENEEDSFLRREYMARHAESMTREGNAYDMVDVGRTGRSQGGAAPADDVEISSQFESLATAAKAAAEALTLINGQKQASITGTSGPTI